LARVASPSVATRLLLLGETFTGKPAMGAGLVHRCVPPEQLGAALDSLLEALRAAAPVALRYAKETVHSASELALPDGLRLEADLVALLQTTSDRAEGIEAFLAHRQPGFQGR
jgi:enoyl-CoA hydratase/carnithine racemase